MKFIKKLETKQNKNTEFCKADYYVLDYNQLLEVNGAKGESGGGGPSGPSSSPSSSSPSNTSSSSSSSSSGSGKGGSSGGQSAPSSSTTNDTSTNIPTDTTSSSPAVTNDGYIENSNYGVANAKPGDQLKRDDGTIVTITQGDINWAKEQLAKESANSNNDQSITNNSGETGTFNDDSMFDVSHITTGGSTENVDGDSVANISMVVPTYTEQRDFSDEYDSNFGEHACAATSLLNEISEEYTRQTGMVLTEEQINQAMDAAVDAGGVSDVDANVDNWELAANAMADAVGLEGNYSYITDPSQASAIIYACNPDSEGNPGHFVNDIGNGQYYDPWSGQIGNISDLNLCTSGNGSSRNLVYSN